MLPTNTFNCTRVEENFQRPINSLSRVENEQANPTLKAIEVIANAFGLTVFDLFEKVKE